MKEKKKPILAELENNIMIVPLIFSLILTLIGLVLKFLGDSAATATTYCIQLSYYAFAWYVCLSLSCCIRDRKYLSIQALSGLYPKPLQTVIAILNELIELVVIIVFFIFSYVIVKIAISEHLMNPAAPSIPVVISYFAPIVGFTFSILRKIERLIKEGIHQ